jgi:hypothetical protein
MKTHHGGGPSGMVSNGINTTYSGEPDKVIQRVEIQDNPNGYDI